ncbi:unnamed protein product [Diabrotica balteata]|uniref:Transport and Golgi organization protein 6 homolog n=2 Tax=Diabrotica balteata TaxID=107213 RepID=A0A9N9X8F3_DIABA|nr:unnamed protein product [Diabrotica balteata]
MCKMNKNQLLECVKLLKLAEIKDGSYTSFLESGLSEVYNKLGIKHDDVLSEISDIASLNFSNNIDLEWKYICLAFFIIKALGKESENADDVFLSVQETRDLRGFINDVVIIGIQTKLQPTLPFHMQSKYFVSEDIFWSYNILKCTTFGLTEFMKLPVLRLCILPENLKVILAALYQISYGPVKKPSDESTASMTKEIYEKLIHEQRFFLQILNHLEQSVHPSIFIRETMVMFNAKIPSWFKKHLFQNLTSILRSQKGVQTVASALFGNCESNTQNWKILDVFSKLILYCMKFPDFKENICKQLIDLLHNQSSEQTIAENIFTHCTKIIYTKDTELCNDVFVKNIMTHLICFTQKAEQCCKGDITETIKLTSRLLNAVFVESNAQENVLPSSLLTKIVSVIFRFFVTTIDSSFKTVNNDLADILLVFFESNQEKSLDVLDTILFNLKSSEILEFRDDVEFDVQANRITLRQMQHSVQYSPSENCEAVLKLYKRKPKLLVSFFGYLLNCISNESKYFPKNNEGLIQVEEDFTTSYIERKIVVYKLVSELADERDIQKQLNEKPGVIVDYIYNVLNRTLELSTHTKEDCDSEGFQSVFTILMILQNLLETSDRDSLIHYDILLDPLKKIKEESENKETKDIIHKILKILQGYDVSKRKNVEEKDKAELDQILEDVCDPLLPTRGHGLICLSKLIEKKDPDVMERKQYILNLLLQNLTNKDSFIYLSAINGLAAMTDVFPDTILKILCDEYSDSNRKDVEDSSESRMKLGEVLVKVSKILGDMAPKYKPILLNTFLTGTRDEDDLIRASSLSNLGEICQILGYKLGSMFSEVLSCVHAVISTDKSPQARRAAVTVIRQLFVGLDQEIISFFKEDILPVYRTLKQIYSSDKDDVMRLQAQLALEQLNESMKNFVFPNAQLHSEKKIVMLS